MKRFISILSAFLLLACMAGSAAALDIQPTVLPDGTVGVAYSQILQATGGTGPFTFSATGLPAGLSIASDGTISGTPTTDVDMGGYGFIAHFSYQ